jgi:ABC-type antimicrobial peptide transport system permease subunit
MSRLVAGLLAGVDAKDPIPFGAATLVLAAVACAGCYLPARRAIRVSPIVALRG